MIYINNEIRGYVSKVTDKGKYSTATLSTSRKDKQTDEYIKSYWDIKFIGGTPHDGKITITKASMSKEKAKDGKYYLNMAAFEWEQEPKDEIPAGFAALDDSEDFSF